MEHPDDVYQQNPQRAVRTQLAKAKDNLSHLRQNHESKRKQYIADSIIKYSKLNEKKASIMKSIQTREAVRKMHQKLKLISSARKTQMFSLQLQDVNGRWQVTDKRDEIEQALHDYIAIHFEQPQMDICPLMMDHYLDVFGHDIYTCQGRSLNSSREINFPFNISPLEESIFEELKPLDLSNITA